MRNSGKIGNFLIALLMVASLTLAGCGGGGGGGTTDDTMTGPTPAEMAAEAAHNAVHAAEEAVMALNAMSTDADAMAAEALIAAAEMALMNDDLTAADAESEMSALDMVKAALATVNAQRATHMAEQQVAALQAQINALRAQLGLAPADNLSDSVADLQQLADDLAQRIKDEEDAAAEAASMELAATAAKLFKGISRPVGTTGSPAATDRIAGYNTAETGIDVSIGDGSNTPTPIALSEDKKTMVYDNHGWKGKRYADPAGGDSVEAVVFSDVEAPKEGKKFGGAAANDEFEYALTNGMITVDTTQTGVPARVALTGVTRTAGTETFKLPDPNPQGATMINVPGSFHGVSGTYSCTPTTPASGCMASVAASGFTLIGGAWTFRPGDANARVMSADDTMYASYGWWLHKTENGKTFTASAFFDYKGGDGSAELASNLDTLNGSATYMGGAAGKYALSSSTGGMNDAGHFTARATLEADFTDNMISGTIDMFMGADGMMRDWSVELMDSAVSATGVIVGDGTSGNTDRQMTKWTVGGTAGDPSGEWNGQLYENGTDGVPKTAAGTFFTEYGQGNRMVGAFGANKQ